jgi:hypothetical protein
VCHIYIREDEWQILQKQHPQSALLFHSPRRLSLIIASALQQLQCIMPLLPTTFLARCVAWCAYPGLFHGKEQSLL